MGKHTVNGRHPMALQAELKAKEAKLKAAGHVPAPAPAPPPPPAPAATVSSAPPGMTLKEKLEALPDEELVAIAFNADLPAIDDREELIKQLVAAEVTV